MYTDPIAAFTAADTLLATYVWVQPLNIPPELTSVFASWSSAGRCIAKPGGQLRFVLNSVLDLGFPAALDFDVTFVGTVVQLATLTSPVAYIRFDVNQVVQTTFTLPSGLAVFVDTVTGKITPGAVSLRQPFTGQSCSGQSRVFDVFFAWLRGFNTPVNPGIDLTVVMSINGQERTLTLSLNGLAANTGEPGITRMPIPVEAIVNEILIGVRLDTSGLVLPHQPIPPWPFQQAMRDALLGLASAQLAWATHARADGRRLQQAALSAVEGAVGRMRSTVDADEPQQ